MRGAFAALILLAGCASARPGDVRNMNPDVDTKGYATYSWGQPGATFEFYEDATLECLARAAKFTPDLSGETPMAQAPTTSLDSMDAMISQAWVVENAQIREARRQRQGVIDACLTELGFVKFGLTDAQLAVLDALPRGTEERKHYLHSLGSDPAILRAQGL